MRLDLQSVLNPWSGSPGLQVLFAIRAVKRSADRLPTCFLLLITRQRDTCALLSDLRGRPPTIKLQRFSVARVAHSLKCRLSVLQLSESGIHRGNFGGPASDSWPPVARTRQVRDPDHHDQRAPSVGLGGLPSDPTTAQVTPASRTMTDALVERLGATQESRNFSSGSRLVRDVHKKEST